MTEQAVEVAVVGAGFAGLAAAQVLGRAQRDVVVLGSGPTRNAEAQHAHNILTRDGTPPGDLLELGRSEVEALPTVTLVSGYVEAIQPAADTGLRVQVGGGADLLARAVLVATGARDTLPDIDGLAAVWGRRAHSCPFCDAAQYAGQRIIAIADEARAAHVVPLLRGWSTHVQVLDPSDVAEITEDGDSLVVRLSDGSETAGDGMFVGVAPQPGLSCVADLLLDRRGPFLAVDGQGRTSLPGLWAAGDCTWREGDAGPGGQVIAAMAAGSRSAISIILETLGVEVPSPPPVERRRGESAT